MRFQIAKLGATARGARPLHSTAARRQTDVPQANGKKLSPQEAKAEAARLAMKSLKDMGSLFSSGGDDASQPIDTAPVFHNHKLFGTLSLLHQGQVVQELQEKYDGKWTKLSTNDKKLGYYMAYGDWGVREHFANWNTHEPPLDLPFRVPSQIRTAWPKPSDKVHKLDRVILAETPVRLSQFDTSKMDPITKTFIYLTLLVVVFALARDKNTGEAGRPVEFVVEDSYLKQKAARQREQEQAQEQERQRQQQQQQRRKWYYLWLR